VDTWTGAQQGRGFCLVIAVSSHLGCPTNVIGIPVVLIIREPPCSAANSPQRVQSFLQISSTTRRTSRSRREERNRMKAAPSEMNS
jgi:hypothetical protein